MLTITLTLALVAAAAPQGAGNDGAPVADPVKVSGAIEKGVEFVKRTPPEQVGAEKELMLLALLHAGVSRRDPYLTALLGKVLAAPLERTYNVSLQAMFLEDLERVRYQGRILQCAQFLVDNQTAQGIWGYGTPTLAAAEPYKSTDVATADPKARELGEEAPGSRKKPPVRVRLTVKRTRTAPYGADNSNSQYALLGLRACHDAGVDGPREVLVLARKWFREQQEQPEGAGGAGWTYGEHAGKPAWGSMTAGAAGSLAICGFLLGEGWKDDRALQRGTEWLASHFSVAENPGFPQNGQHYYYLYALERAGILCQAEKLGKRSWYAEGAKFLLDAQRPEGSWNANVVDTCFAILFLRRSTYPLVETRDRYISR